LHRLATDLIRQRKKDQAAVRKLAFDLRALVLSSGRTTAPLKTSSSTDNSNASPLAPTTAVTTPEKKTTPSSTLLKPELALTRNVSRDSIPVPASESNGSEETSKKKKPKKKKRSVLANQANPHHVNNCELQSSGIIMTRSLMSHRSPNEDDSRQF